MQVYKFLAGQSIKVMVGIRREHVLSDFAQTAHAKGLRFQPDDVYDNLVKTIFKRLLHNADRNIVCFARRGKSARQLALQRAINKAQANFSRDVGKSTRRSTDVITAVPSDMAGLQVIDYFLWALQRLYEREEDRYFNYLREHFKLIMDLDDGNPTTNYSTWYSDRNPLTKGKMLPMTS